MSSAPHGGTELEPYFVKALKLLQSKTKESTIQLKAMLDDVIAQRKGLKPARLAYCRAYSCGRQCCQLGVLHVLERILKKHATMMLRTVKNDR